MFGNTIKGNGFTLVELIVVITILAILSTIGFISFQGFTVKTRDSKRIAEIRMIEGGFINYHIKENIYPTPDEYLTITASGTSLIQQGYAGETVLAAAKVVGKASDPLSQDYYNYSRTINGSSYQLSADLESGSMQSTLTPHTYANNSYFMEFAGDDIGLIYSSGGLAHKVHSGSLDILQTSENIGVMFATDTILQTESGSLIFSKLYNKNASLAENPDIATLDEHLVAYWQLNNLSQTGSVQNLSQYNTLDMDTKGGIDFTNKGMKSNGVNQYLLNRGVASGLLDYTTGDEFTYCSGFKRYSSDLASTSFLISKPWNGSGNYNMTLAIFGDPGYIRFQFMGVDNSSQTSAIATYSSNDIKYDTFHYVCASIDKNQLSKIYIDGKLNAQEANSQVLNEPIGSYNPRFFALGTLFPYTNDPWIGNTDHVLSGEIYDTRIYNRVLNSYEVQSLYEHALIKYNEN